MVLWFITVWRKVLLEGMIKAILVVVGAQNLGNNTIFMAEALALRKSLKCAKRKDMVYIVM